MGTYYLILDMCSEYRFYEEWDCYEGASYISDDYYFTHPLLF